MLCQVPMQCINSGAFMFEPGLEMFSALMWMRLKVVGSIGVVGLVLMRAR